MKYTSTEIAKHDSKGDCWIYANKNVYDVTHFINKHPGGSNSILRYAGTDCTTHYNFHTKEGKKIWEKYRIGRITK